MFRHGNSATTTRFIGSMGDSLGIFRRDQSGDFDPEVVDSEEISDETSHAPMTESEETEGAASRDDVEIVEKASRFSAVQAST